MQRIVIIGTTGSGKTTLARALAQRLAVPHVELDAMFWLPDWKERDRDETRQAVTAAVSESAWVVDGNYSFVRDVVWQRADTLVWLDYPLMLSQWRLFWRTLRRTLSGEVLWGSNRERFWMQFMSRESLFLWAMKQRPKHHRDYPILFQQPEYAHLTIIRLHSPRETEAWLNAINSGTH